MPTGHLARTARPSVLESASASTGFGSVSASGDFAARPLAWSTGIVGAFARSQELDPFVSRTGGAGPVSGPRAFSESGAVDAGPAIEAVEGDLTTGLGWFSAPPHGYFGGWDIVVTFGDGFSAQLYAAQPGTFSWNHRYQDDGVFTVQVTVYIHQTNFVIGTDTTTATISNAPPQIHFQWQSADTITEGTDATLAFYATDPGQGDQPALSYEVNWGDGSVDSAPTWGGMWQHFYRDDDPTGTPADNYTITITVRDDDGGVASLARHLIILNDVVQLVPILNDWDEPQGFFEGQTIHGFGLFEFWGDQGWWLDDSYTVTVDWGDGSAPTHVAFTRQEFESEFARLNDELTHVYLDDDPTDTPFDLYTVTITMTDDDGGSASVEVPIYVCNAAPTAELEQARRSRPGEIFAVTFTIVDDPGVLDTHEFAVDWNNDGDLNDEGEAWSTSRTHSWSYEAVGQHAFTAYLRDDDGAVTTLPSFVHVGWADLDGKDAAPDSDWASELLEDDLGILVLPMDVGAGFGGALEPPTGASPPPPAARLLVRAAPGAGVRTLLWDPNLLWIDYPPTGAGRIDLLEDELDIELTIYSLPAFEGPGMKSTLVTLFIGGGIADQIKVINLNVLRTAVGHHWLPVSVLKDFHHIIEEDAWHIALGYVSGPTLDAQGQGHTFGTYGGVTHFEYNARVKKLFTKFCDRRGASQANRLSAHDMLDFITKIRDGIDPNTGVVDTKLLKPFNDEILAQRARLLAASGDPETLGRMTLEKAKKLGQRFVDENRDRVTVVSVKKLPNGTFHKIRMTPFVYGAALFGLVGDALYKTTEVINVVSGSNHFRNAMSHLQNGLIQDARDELAHRTSPSLYLEISNTEGLGYVAEAFHTVIVRMFDQHNLVTDA